MAHEADRKGIRDTRKKYRALGRTAVKAIRKAKEGTRAERRAKIGGTRAFHKVDKEGHVGGFAGFGAYAAKVSAKAKKKSDRKAVRAEKKTARVAKRTTKKRQKTEMKEKKSLSSYAKNDLDFFKRNAKQRGMKLHEYYDKYVK
jgi:hypothetical protein